MIFLNQLVGILSRKPLQKKYIYSMNSNKYLILMAISTLVFACCSFISCSPEIKRGTPPTEMGSIDKPEIKVLRIMWNFRYTGTGENIYTNAVIIVKGKHTQSHSIGSFYGKVVSTIKSDDINTRQLPVATVSGFITRHNNEGHEVYALYDRDLHRINIVTRQLVKKNNTAPFRTIMTIPVAEAGTVRSTFTTKE